MSKLINIGPLITKIARDLLEQEDTVLDVETVYAKLEADHGDAIFESAHQLAARSIKQSIKSHLRKAHSVGGELDDRQKSFLREEPAAIAVKQPDGGYGYVPLRAATVDVIEAATKSKERNITNAKAALDRWTKFIQPILSLMKERKISFGEAQKLQAKLAEKAKKQVPTKKVKETA